MLRWLQYWVVFSFSNVLEFFSDQIVCISVFMEI